MWLIIWSGRLAVCVVLFGYAHWLCVMRYALCVMRYALCVVLWAAAGKSTATVGLMLKKFLSTEHTGQVLVFGVLSAQTYRGLSTLSTPQRKTAEHKESIK